MRSFGLPLRLCWPLAGALALGLNATIALAEGPPPPNPAQGISSPPSVEPATSAASPSPRKHAPRRARSRRPRLSQGRAPRASSASRPLGFFRPLRARRDSAAMKYWSNSPPNVSQQNIALILRRHRLTESEAAPIALLGTSLHLWRIADARSPGDVLRELGGEPLIASAQPNYVFALQEDASAGRRRPIPPPAVPQYALVKLHVEVTRTLDDRRQGAGGGRRHRDRRNPSRSLRNRRGAL